MECRIPEYGDESLDDFWRKVKTVDDDDGEDGLHVVHETSEHPDDCRSDEEEGGVDFDLANQGSGSLVFPHHVEVRFKASEGENKCHKEAASADKSELSDGNVLCIFDEIHDLFGRPVQIEHVDHDGKVVRNEVSEPDRKRNGGEHDEKRDDCHESRISQ